MIKEPIAFTVVFTSPALSGRTEPCCELQPSKLVSGVPQDPSGEVEDFTPAVATDDETATLPWGF